MPASELPEQDELVSSAATLAEPPLPNVSPPFDCMQLSMRTFGVSGSWKWCCGGGGDGVVGNNGHVDVSSSTRNGDSDGDVFNVCCKSTFKSVGFVEIFRLFIIALLVFFFSLSHFIRGIFFYFSNVFQFSPYAKLSIVTHLIWSWRNIFVRMWTRTPYSIFNQGKMLKLSVVAELATSSDNAQIDKIDEYSQSCELRLANQHTILFLFM